MTSEVFLEDCMLGMKRYPDKFFDLAVVDPPYGVGDWQTVGDADGWNLKAQKKYGKVDWNDYTPGPEYFEELYRVSKHTIIWGANYYNSFSKTGGAIVWDKKSDKNRYSDGDIASCSMQKKISFFRYAWNGFLQEDMSNKEVRIHSCQKPVALYSWIYANYLPKGGKVIDTHLGSGSNRIAADKAGNIDFTGFEIDPDYYAAQEKRWKEYKAQLKLF